MCIEHCFRNYWPGTSVKVAPAFRSVIGVTPTPALCPTKKPQNYRTQLVHVEFIADAIRLAPPGHNSFAIGLVYFLPSTVFVFFSHPEQLTKSANDKTKFVTNRPRLCVSDNEVSSDAKVDDAENVENSEDPRNKRFLLNLGGGGGGGGGSGNFVFDLIRVSVLFNIFYFSFILSFSLSLSLWSYPLFISRNRCHHCCHVWLLSHWFHPSFCSIGFHVYVNTNNDNAKRKKSYRLFTYSRDPPPFHRGKKWIETVRNTDTTIMDIRTGDYPFRVDTRVCRIFRWLFGPSSPNLNYVYGNKFPTLASIVTHKNNERYRFGILAPIQCALRFASSSRL